MARRIQFRRIILLLLLLLLAFAGLGYRLVDLQVVRHDELLVKAQQNTQREFLIEPRRGDILDARGSLLAMSVFVKTVCADPMLIGNRQLEVARALAPLLQISESELYQRLQPKVRTNDSGKIVTNRYVVLKRKVTFEAWDKIRATMRELPLAVNEAKLSKTERQFYNDLRRKAVFVDPIDDQLRIYPNQNLAAHVLGFVGMAEKEQAGMQVLETSGKDGIELTFDSKLRGVRGWRLTETDGKRREMVTFREQDVEAHDGFNVVLTIDSAIQSMVEAALAEAMQKHAPISISGMVVRPRTGEILALATLPNFDPNHPGSASADARRNRVISDIMEPGSTFKIVVVSGALNEGMVRLTDNYDCDHGAFHFAGRTLHDHESYGVLSVENIITKSSNIGAAKIGIRLGDYRLYDYIRAFGFGSSTAIPLPGEVGGIVHPTKHWSKVSIAQIPMGHGIAVTRLQMTMAMCAIANKGALMRPMLVDRLEDREGHVIAKYNPERVRQVIAEPTARLMVTALKTVVGPDGTAPKAALEHYTVAGKTGTAQKAGPGGYMPGKYVSSFIGFFPADNPELCISIVMDEPKQGYYGGQTAAPVFKAIAESAANYLNIRPDLDDGERKIPETIAAPNENRTTRSAAARL